MKAILKPCKRKEFENHIKILCEEHPQNYKIYQKYYDYITSNTFGVEKSYEKGLSYEYYITDFLLKEDTYMAIREDFIIIKENK